MTAFGRFEQIQVGDTATLARTIGPDEVRRFVELTGDDNPLHVDRAFAERTPFKGVVVHGMLGASFLSTVIGTQLPGHGALWVSQSLEFLHPVRLGDRLEVRATVTRKIERERLLELDAVIENAGHTVVLRGKGTVRVLQDVPGPEAAPGQRLKVAVVAGGAGGIGRAVCRRLARDGWKVVVGHRGDPERALAVVDAVVEAGGEAAAARADLTEPTGAATLVQAALRRFGGLGLLVSAASPAIAPAALDALPWDDLQRQLDTQVKGTLLLAQAALPALRAHPHGRIVVVTSQVAEGAPPPRWGAYAVGKAALAALVRALAVELGPFGVTANAVAPGMTETALIGDVPEKVRLMVARSAPLRRLATPEDVAGAVAWLASPDADYLTGETVRVNGGQVMS
jgi:3-oxoacyl-[acyl-carrier protein] reductase